jgi:hypothetical protein
LRAQPVKGLLEEPLQVTLTLLQVVVALLR